MPPTPLPHDGLVPNADAADWMAANVPLFDCPDATFEKIYYFRWWTFRKHIKQTPQGYRADRVSSTGESRRAIQHGFLCSGASCG